MAKSKRKAFNHSGLLFLILILFFIIVINCLPFFITKDVSEVVFDGDSEIKLSEMLPITDISGKNLKIEKIQDGIIGYSEFTLKSPEICDDVVDFEVYLTDITEGDTFKYDYVKIYLTDENGIPYKMYDSNLIPTYADMRNSLNDPEKRIILTDRIKCGQKKIFKLRIWLSETYVLSDKEKEFLGKISVKTIE